MSHTEKAAKRVTWKIFVAASVALFLMSLLAFDAAGAALAGRAEDRARDPKTGILPGAEAYTLGPEDAPVAVLLVHGFVGAGNNFGDLPERLGERGWFVDVMRLPGHGTRPQDLKDVTSDDLLDAVVSEVRGLRAQHQRVVLVGHSMGGALATLAAAQEPVDALVLAAPYFGVTRHWYYGLAPETWFELTSPAVPWWYKGRLFLQVNRKEAKSQIVSYVWVPAQALRTLMELGQRASQRDVLQRVTCPVLLVHGKGDVAASLTAAGRAVDAMASSTKERVELPRSNHHLFWDYDAEQAVAAIDAFLAAQMRDGD